MLCCCERDEQTSSRIMSDYNIDLGEWGVSSVPALMAKIVVTNKFLIFFSIRVRVLSKYHVRALTGQLNLFLLGAVLAGLTEESK